MLDPDNSFLTGSYLVVEALPAFFLSLDLSIEDIVFMNASDLGMRGFKKVW